ncbi:MAG TPA: TIGR00725 family protein, partial [Anaerolineae bacterium]|nr:TIGR00725 family protein [Anaerolineae bacterium]
MSKLIFIAVIGSAHCDAQTAALAEAVGRQIARRGAGLVCGGRGGVMEAACRGAKAAGGLTVGILPGADRREANPYVDVPIVTSLGEARNALVVRSAEAVVAVSGGYGTLSEIALALKMGRPVVGLNTWPIEAVIPARTPQEAVDKAWGLLE